MNTNAKRKTQSAQDTTLHVKLRSSFIKTFLSSAFCVLRSALVVLFALPLWSGNEGTTGADFLKLGYGARAVGMGEAFSAVSEDPAAPYWNPAGAAAFDRPVMNLSTTIWFAGIRYGMFSFLRPLFAKGSGVPKAKMSRPTLSAGSTQRNSEEAGSGWVWGAGLIYLDAGKISETTLSSDGTSAIVVDDDIGASDKAFLVTLAHEKNRLCWGGNLKLIHRTLARESASAFAADAGMQMILWEGIRSQKLTGGLSLLNMGTRLDFRSETSETDSLPLLGKAGLAWNHNKLLLTGDLWKSQDSPVRLNLGLEYEVSKIFLRAGYKAFGYDARDTLGGLFGYSFGVGIPFFVFPGSLDYAVAPYGDLGLTHHMSLNIPF